METAAGSKEWPRSAERRHFRGDNAKKSVEYLKSRGVDSLFKPLVGNDLTVQQVMEEVQSWVGFGPWISYKVADMLERLDISKVNFRTTDSVIYKSPLDGIKDLWKIEKELQPFPSNSSLIEWGMSRLEEKLGDLLAPPRYERRLDYNEFETCYCKWHSHLSGKYPVGKDCHEIKEGLLRFAKCETSQKLLAAGRGRIW
jgi:hypothetical protein